MQRCHCALAAVGIKGDGEGVLIPDRIQVGVIVKAEGRAVSQRGAGRIRGERPAEELRALTGKGIEIERDAVCVQRNVLRGGLIGVIVGMEGQRVVILLPDGKELQIVLAGDHVAVVEELVAVGAVRPVEEVVALAGERIGVQRGGDVHGNYLRRHGAFAAVGVEGHGVGACLLLPDGVDGDVLGIELVSGIDCVALIAPHVLDGAIGILGPADKVVAAACERILGELDAVGSLVLGNLNVVHHAGAAVRVKGDGVAVEGLEPLVLGGTVRICIARSGACCQNVATVTVLQHGGVDRDILRGGGVAELRDLLCVRLRSGPACKRHLSGHCAADDARAALSRIE